MDQPTISTAPLSITLLLGIEAADPMRLGHPADALHQGRRSQRDLFALGRRPDPVDGARHDLLKTRDDLALPPEAVSYTHLRAHETPEHLVCRLLLEKKKKKKEKNENIFR